MKCLHSKKWRGYTSRHPLLSHWISEAPALSWRDLVPADVQHRASSAIKNNKSLPGIVWRAFVQTKRDIEALIAKASGLFALDVEIMNLKAVVKQIASRFMSKAKVDIEVVSDIIETESYMPDPQVVPGNATAAANVNTAIQIALALKSIDASLTVEAVQAGTNAALTALYPLIAA